MVRGMVCFNADSYDKVLLMSEYVRMMENFTAERIGCVEEIIIRRGIADYEEVMTVSNQDTQEYLRELFK